MNTNPLITIITPTFNRPEFLKETIDSIINQTYTNWEYLIIDDGSDHNHVEYIKKLSATDSRIIFLNRDRSPKGASTCRNIGIEESTGEYIIFLDSDDLFTAHCLEQRIKMFKDHSECDFLVFQMQKFYKIIGDDKHIWNIDKQESDLIRFIQRDAVWSISGPIWRKNFLTKINGFDESFPNAQDLELHIRALLKSPLYKKFLHLTPDTYNRWHNKSSISQDGYTKSKATYIAQLKLLKTLTASISISNRKLKNATHTYSIRLYKELTKAGYISLRTELISILRNINIYNRFLLFRISTYKIFYSIFLSIENLIIPQKPSSLYKNTIK